MCIRDRDKVVSYFKFLYNVTDFSTVNKKVEKEIDDFQFPSSPEFLVVESTRNEVDDGHHVEWFNAKDDIKVKREVLKLAQLMLGLFCCSKTISYQ